MSYKWDWNKRELVEGDAPGELPIWKMIGAVLIIPGVYYFIEVVCPFLGHFLFGAFL